MQLGEHETIIIAILVLFLGKYLTGRIRFLREYNIPAVAAQVRPAQARTGNATG
jgi:sodium--glutamate symport carrier gltS